jgi:protein ImuA
MSIPAPRSSGPDVLPSPYPSAVWRADQMGRYQAPVTASGHAMLDDELPNRGWPASALIELLLQQPGIGEMQLLRPALGAIARQRRIVLIQPPHAPQIAAWSSWGLPHAQLLWINTRRSADALWSAEQVLRNGSCGALLFWQAHVRSESLRRLQLAAQASDMLFWMLRPLNEAQEASPALLRLGLRPACGGIDIEIVKRRGPRRDEALFLPLSGMPQAPSTSTMPDHALVDSPVPAVAAARNNTSALV